MKPKEIFTLAVRLLGLVFLYHGLQALPIEAEDLLSALRHFEVINILSTLVLAVWPLIVAYWLLSGAALLVQIAYPNGEP